jgi:hypothetical protein
VVWLEHEWAPLPQHLRLPGPCLKPNCAGANCLKSPSNVVSPCSCALWECQHFCSALTMEESGATEFSIHVNSTVSWWVGIIWSSNHDGLQTPESNTLFDSDSMRHVPNIYACVLNYCGMISSYDCIPERFRSFGPGFDNFPKSGAIVTIKLLNDHVEFSVGGLGSRTIHLQPFRVNGLYARPFVQFETRALINLSSSELHRLFQRQNLNLIRNSLAANSFALITTPLSDHS